MSLLNSGRLDAEADIEAGVGEDVHEPVEGEPVDFAALRRLGLSRPMGESARMVAEYWRLRF